MIDGEEEGLLLPDETEAAKGNSQNIAALTIICIQIRARVNAYIILQYASSKQVSNSINRRTAGLVLLDQESSHAMF